MSPAVIASIVFVALSAGALLNLEMNQPLEGALKISSAPMRYALGLLGQ